MSISATPKSAAANVQQAAWVLPASTDGSGDVDGLPGQLDDLAAALRLAAQACDAATDRVVPKRAGDARIARMYAEAAIHWSGRRAAPSHERFAMALAELNRSAGAVRRAAADVERAREAVERLLEKAHAHGVGRR